MKELRNIAFYSRSNEVFECLEEEIFQRWNFFLTSPDLASPKLDRVFNPSLLIIDTYSLGMEFLEFIFKHSRYKTTPILVLDFYTEKPFIENLIDKGAAGYLLVHSFADELDIAMTMILGGKNYISNQLEIYKGNTYLIK
ncbi:response regulator transcription factor [Fulvivirga sediminis]|uniref:Response regulator transcription factor n=1 Tax=Fulvivirga sediminis TaxID=2803949 RepID=A0A937K105_9BACT|nr:response regulator transcription factor [Fulvivirga sediminis]MBL3658868.1 response regulator transcription factor [Fulvivirga sediminis]